MFNNKICCCLAFSKQKAAPVLLEVSGRDPSVTFDNKSAVRRQLAPYCDRGSFKLPFAVKPSAVERELMKICKFNRSMAA